MKSLKRRWRSWRRVMSLIGEDVQVDEEESGACTTL